MRVLLALAATALLSITAAACTSTADDGVAGGTGAFSSTPESESSCSPEDLEISNRYFGWALETATHRLAGTGECSQRKVENIIGYSQISIEQCPAFVTKIETSADAKPIREALKGNLAMAIFTGKLKMFDEQFHHLWRGLEESLPGVTIWWAYPGQWNTKKLTFAANGAATMSTRQVESDGTITWSDVPATYRIAPWQGDRGPEMTITVGAVAKVYEIGGMISPYTSIDLVNLTDEHDRFDSIPVECYD